MRPGWNAQSPGAILDKLAAERPGAPFIVDSHLQVHTRGAVLELARSAAHALAQRGVRRGDRVLVMSRNRVEVFATAFAVWRLGAIFVPLNHEQRGTILKGWIEDSEPAVVVADDQGRAALASADVTAAYPLVDIGEVCAGAVAASSAVRYEP